MIQKLEKHLTSLFFLTTGAILTLVLVVLFFYQTRINLSEENERFQSQLLDLTHRLEGTSTISDDWLAKLEGGGKLIIHIEDNGHPLFFPGAWTPKTNREHLIKLAREEALNEGVNTQVEPHSLSVAQSSVFKIKGEHHDNYLATAMVISSGKGFRSLILLADASSAYGKLLFQFVLFLLLELLGVISLYLASRHLVKRAVEPVKIYHEKQNAFIAAASHELRSPLAVIKASASAMKSMPEKSAEMISLIERECTRSGNLIKNLLLLSSSDTGETDIISLEDVEIDSILLQVFENYEVLCNSKGIHLRLKLPDELLPNVKGNSQWIYQILCILLDNAIAYGCVGSSDILLAAHADKQHVSVAVTDHGKGIPDEIKSHIFDRFYRADASRNDKEHAGLGLSIAKMLADKMEASICVEDAPGGGARFCIRFHQN